MRTCPSRRNGLSASGNSPSRAKRCWPISRLTSRHGISGGIEPSSRPGASLAALGSASYSRLAMTDLFPPFAPDPLEPRRRRFKPVPFRVIAPNLVTVLALCLGLTAIRLAYEGHLDTAVICIIVAGVLDGLDGRLARFLKGTSRFGAELDSLSDFVCFGVAPALILYGFILQSLKGLGWVAALLFAIASALRLARFNV